MPTPNEHCVRGTETLEREHILELGNDLLTQPRNIKKHNGLRPDAQIQGHARACAGRATLKNYAFTNFRLPMFSLAHFAFSSISPSFCCPRSPDSSCLHLPNFMFFALVHARLLLEGQSRNFKIQESTVAIRSIRALWLLSAFN